MKDRVKPKIPHERDSKREYIRYLGAASIIGISFVINACVGLAIGWILDKKVFNTFPWLTIIFLILGIAAGFKHLFKLASKAGKYTDSTENEK